MRGWVGQRSPGAGVTMSLRPCQEAPAQGQTLRDLSWSRPLAPPRPCAQRRACRVADGLAAFREEGDSAELGEAQSCFTLGKPRPGGWGLPQGRPCRSTAPPPGRARWGVGRPSLLSSPPPAHAPGDGCTCVQARGQVPPSLSAVFSGGWGDSVLRKVGGLPDGGKKWVVAGMFLGVPPGVAELCVLRPGGGGKGGVRLA